MGKTCISFGGVAMTSFIAYTAAAASSTESHWYLTILLMLSILALSGFVVTGVIYLWQKIHEYKIAQIVLTQKGRRKMIIGAVLFIGGTVCVIWGVYNIVSQLNFKNETQTQQTHNAPIITIPTNNSSKLSILMLGGNIFVPDGSDVQRPLTGIALDAKVWNIGTPSVAVEWSLVVTPKGQLPISAQYTKMPEKLTLNGPPTTVVHSSDSLDGKTANKSIGDTPVQGTLLFYVKLEKDVVLDPSTSLDLTVKDIYGGEASDTKLMGNWLTSPPTSPSFEFPTFIDSSKIDPIQPVEIHLGSFTFLYKWSDFADGKRLQPVQMNELYSFTIHTFGNRLYADVSVYGGNDLIIIKIVDNVATVIPKSWDKNQDDYAYEVVNESGTPIFQLIYDTQFSISIYGIFPMPGGLVLWAKKSGNSYGNSPFVTLNLKPIFQYPSSEFQRQRVAP
jgi:hypothetical protein